MLRKGEQRGYLRLVLAVHGHDVILMNTHIDYLSDDAEGWSNVSEIEQLAKQDGASPTILCGDFNDTPDSRVCRRISQTFDDSWALAGHGDGFTIPAEKPRKRIDYLWISKDKSVVPLKVWVPQSEASD